MLKAGVLEHAEGEHEALIDSGDKSGASKSENGGRAITTWEGGTRGGGGGGVNVSLHEIF